MGNHLAANCNVDNLFGLRVMGDTTGNYVNIYTNYLLDSGQAADELELTLRRYVGVWCMRYHPTDNEQSMLLAKIRDYCQMCRAPLDQRREQYLAEQDVDASVPPPQEQSM